MRDALVGVIRQRYGAQPPYLRLSQAAPGQADLTSRVIAARGARALQQLAHAAQLGCAPWLTGVYDFDAPHAPRMNHWLAQVPHGSLLMCHPAASVQSGDAIGAARTREYAHLRSDDFARQLRTQAVILVRGAALYKAD